MAEFLSKENVNVSSGSQSTHNLVTGTLAQDLQTLMGGISAIGKDYVKSQVAESKKIGELLARDMLIGLTKEKGLIFDEIAQNPQDDKLYQKGIDRINDLNANNIAQVKERLGSDSIAYQEFEDKYLFRGTEYSEGIKGSLNSEKYKVIRVNNISVLDKQLNEGVEISDSNFLLGLKDSYKQNGLTDDQISEKVVSTYVGSAIAKGFDATKLYNSDGSLNTDKAISTFRQMYGAIATLNKNGSIEAIGDVVQQKHLDTIARSWKTAIHIEKQKAESNDLFKLNLFAVNNDERKRTLSGDIKTDMDTIAKYEEALKKSFNSVPFNSNANKLEYDKKIEELNQRKTEIEDIYLASQNPATVNQALTNGSIMTKDGRALKINEQELKQVVQAGYKKNFDAIEQTLNDESIDPILKSANISKQIQAVVDIEKQTGVKSSYAKSITDNYKGMSFSSLEDTTKNLRMIQAMQQHGYVFAGDDAMLTPDALKAVETTINTNKEKPFVETKRAIQSTRETFNAKKNVTSMENYNSIKEGIEDILKDKNKFEETTKGLFAGKVSIDALVGLDKKIVQPSESSAIEFATFMAHNNVVQETKDFMIETMIGGNQDSVGIFNGTYTFNLMKYSTNSVAVTPVNLEEISSVLAKQNPQLLKDQLVYTYRYNHATREMVLQVHESDTKARFGGVPVKTLSFDEVNKIMKKYQVDKDAISNVVSSEGIKGRF